MGLVQWDACALRTGVAGQYVHSLGRMMVVATILGSVFTTGGLALSFTPDLPAGQHYPGRRRRLGGVRPGESLSDTANGAPTGSYRFNTERSR